MKNGFIAGMVAKFWSPDKRFRLNWYKHNNKWVLVSIVFENEHVLLDKVWLNQIKPRKFGQLNIKILGNRSIIGLAIKNGLDPSNIINQILGDQK